jgi:hypothetical protein
VDYTKIQTTTSKQIAKMIVVLGRTLRQIKRRALYVLKESTRIRLVSQFVKVAAQGRTTIRLNKSSAPNVKRESTTTKLNRLLAQVVKVAIKASGQTILVVPQTARSATKDSTTIK